MISTLEGHRPTVRCITVQFWNKENKKILKFSREITDQESRIKWHCISEKNSWKLNDNVFPDFVPYSLFIMKPVRYAVSEEGGF